MAELMAVFDAGEDWREADNRFHAAIHQASGNPLFHQLIRQIQQTFNEIYEAPFGEPQLGKATIPMHRDLALSIVEKNEDHAVAIMSRIMDHVEDEVRTIMKGRDLD